MARLFFLTPQLPHPARSGGVIKSRKLIEYLSTRYEVHLFSLLKGCDYDYVEEFSSLVPLAGFHYAPVNIPRTASTFLRSLVAGIPLSVYRNQTSFMTTKLKKAAPDQADVFFVDHFLMFQYVPKDFNGHVILHQHNAEYVMWSRFAFFETRWLRKAAAYVESWRIRSYETYIGRRAQAILAAPNDIEALAMLGIPRAKFHETLHLGDEQLLELSDLVFSNTEYALLSVGSLDWEANRDGLLWFLRDVWPLLSARHPLLRFNIIGRNPGSELEREVARLSGVELLGFVEDLEPYYARARVFVAPLRFGSGIKVKVVNAFYRGLPTSTTPVGAEGLNVESGCEIFIATEASEMVTQIGILLEDEAQWVKLRDASRCLARKEYTWRTSLERVEEALRD